MTTKLERLHPSPWQPVRCQDGSVAVMDTSGGEVCRCARWQAAVEIAALPGYQADSADLQRRRSREHDRKALNNAVREQDYMGGAP